MKKLLSLPPNLVSYFHQIQNVSKDEYFCTNDPVGAKLGSGGGTTWLLRECHRYWAPEIDFNEWLSQEKRILIHAGGQSRRLPSYASSGKILTPIPVFRWARGQRLGQNLLDLQLPLYHRIMDIAPKSIHTMIVSGDVFIRAERLQKIPEADIVCYGLWVDPSLAKNHGVFLSSRQQPGQLDFMLQKPSVEHLAQLMQTHLFLMDVGIWLLSDRAVERLVHKTLSSNGEVSCYDLYSEFGCALGLHPSAPDSMLSDLSVAILPLEGGEFYHYGTSREMISSTMKVQNLVYDQRAIMQLNIKPHPSIFIQNSHSEISLLNTNENTWIENSWINKSWSISHDNIITGVPQNDWAVTLAPGICVDVVPIGEEQYVLRPYGISDSFRGSLTDPQVGYLCRPAIEWFHARDINPNQIYGYEDIQSAQIFPVSSSADSLGHILRFMVMDPTDEQGRQLWTESRKMSADEICSYANLNRLQSQRLQFRRESWEAIASNHRRSVFYQLNLDDAASEFASLKIPEPDMYLVQRGMNDFRQILYNGRRFTPDDFNQEHEKCLKFLKQAVEVSTAKHIVVVTHHLPTLKVVAAQHMGSVLNGAFVIELGNYIAESRIDVWIYGHSHSNIDTTIGNTRVVCNQLGYIYYNEHLTNGFEPNKVIVV